MKRYKQSTKEEIQTANTFANMSKLTSNQKCKLKQQYDFELSDWQLFLYDSSIGIDTALGNTVSTSVN